MTKLKLPNVTLVAVDCVDAERVRPVLDLCEKHFDFGAVKLLTSFDTEDHRAVRTPHLGTIEKFSQFCIEELTDYIDTEYCLLIQHDGFILNPHSWTDEFLKYDYIGAPWIVDDWSSKQFKIPAELMGEKMVGNGGFCLRTKKFLDATAKLAKEGKIKEYHPEDISVCIWHGDLVQKEGIKFAPIEVAERFSIEDERHYSYNNQFGFHGYAWTNIDKWFEDNPGHDHLKERYLRVRNRQEKNENK